MRKEAAFKEDNMTKIVLVTKQREDVLIWITFNMLNACLMCYCEIVKDVLIILGVNL